MKSFLDLTAAQLRRAARIQEKIESLKWDLKSILEGADFAVTHQSRKQGKRVMSETTKAMMAIAREREWWRKAKAAGKTAL